MGLPFREKENNKEEENVRKLAPVCCAYVVNFKNWVKDLLLDTKNSWMLRCNQFSKIHTWRICISKIDWCSAKRVHCLKISTTWPGFQKMRLSREGMRKLSTQINRLLYGRMVSYRIRDESVLALAKQLRHLNQKARSAKLRCYSLLTEKRPPCYTRLMLLQTQANIIREEYGRFFIFEMGFLFLTMTSITN